MPEKIKENFYDLKQQFFYQDKEEEDKQDLNKSYNITKEIIIPPKYIDIINLKEDFWFI